MAKQIKNINKYMRGQTWGEKIAEKTYKSKGFNGLRKLAKAKETCHNYSTNKKITQTKHGEFISKSDRDFYRGASNGIEFIIRKYM